MSDAEQALWNILRGRQVSDLKFRRHHPFGDYILDFVCLENKLVIEVDGGQHGQLARYDENRTQELQAAGFCVLRFWDNEVLKEIESVKEKIWLVVQGLQSHPPPNLPLEGGGVRKVPLEGGRSQERCPLEEKKSKVSAYAHQGGE
jgi:adenine-specific DNA-methyltransferase